MHTLTHSHMFNLFAAVNSINSKPVMYYIKCFGLRMCLRIEFLERKTIECGTRHLLENESVCVCVRACSHVYICAAAKKERLTTVEWMEWKRSNLALVLSQAAVTVSKEKSKVFTWVHGTRADSFFCLFFLLESEISAEWRATVFLSFGFQNKCNQFQLPCELCAFAVNQYKSSYNSHWTLWEKADFA